MCCLSESALVKTEKRSAQESCAQTTERRCPRYGGSVCFMDQICSAAVIVAAAAAEEAGSVTAQYQDQQDDPPPVAAAKATHTIVVAVHNMTS